MKVFFVRHGETNYNLLDLCNDDPSKKVYLTDKGKEQAEEVSRKLGNIKFDLVFVSELPRTQETAKIITRNEKNNFIVDKRINDRSTGFDSKPVTSFYKEISMDIVNTKPKGGESFRNEKARVNSFLEDLKNLKANNVLVSTHSEILKIINGYYNKLSDKEIWETNIDNCQILEVNL